MQSLVSTWPQIAHDIKERHFRKGLYSILCIHDVQALPDQSVAFTWTYMWRDFGLDSTCSKRVRVTPVQGGFVVRDRLVPSLEELEEACFSGEWDQCNQDNLEQTWPCEVYKRVVCAERTRQES